MRQRLQAAFSNEQDGGALQRVAPGVVDDQRPMLRVTPKQPDTGPRHAIGLTIVERVVHDPVASWWRQEFACAAVAGPFSSLNSHIEGSIAVS